MEKVFLLTLTAACALADVQTGKIPNPLILCGILCGAAGRIMASAPAALQPAVLMDGAAGFFLPYLILGLPFFLRMLGGGDVKLLSVNGAAPTVENIENGTYPLASSFFAVTRSDADENTQALLEWICGPQGQALVKKTGYTPMYD